MKTIMLTILLINFISFNVFLHFVKTRLITTLDFKIVKIISEKTKLHHSIKLFFLFQGQFSEIKL